jgi:cytoskeletal protein CcmA (bactofilin family)
MFSKISKTNIETMVANKINEGTVITGDVTAETDIRLDGKILGNINCASKVVIGPVAQITGHIKCNDLTIEGRVKGNLEVTGVLFFRETAMFEGDVKYKKLMVEEGASISGSLVNMNPVTKPLHQMVQNGQTQTTSNPVVQTAG